MSCGLTQIIALNFLHDIILIYKMGKLGLREVLELAV